MMSATQATAKPPEPFEIGLVMAGAISAGAYTAGVMDFLLQALDEWQKAKDANQDVPRHEARIKVMTGASAGGMTAAMTVGALASNFPPVTDATGSDNASNRLFDSWVNRIDIEALLGQEDLADPNAQVKSLLDSSILKSIADRALDGEPTGQRRAYVGEVLHVITTVSNLRGVPYNIPLEGDNKGGHDLYLHADHVHFAISDRGAQQPPGVLRLDWQKADPQFAEAWETLKMAALATGAFPVGLAPRALAYAFSGSESDVYRMRRWPIPTGGKKDENGNCQCVEYKQIAPYWPSRPNPPPRYDFLCVDGGLMNNEPLELAREILAGAGGFNPRDAESARRAVILVDPFPGGDSGVEAYRVQEDLLNVVKDMFNALKNQARFKPEELELAQDPKVFSRFLIGPSRTNEKKENLPFPIASGALGGFGGFLSRDFRQHDFVLGRRNCQLFLKKHFVLAETNPLFESIDQTRKAQMRIKDDKAELVKVDGKFLLPIIPLVGSAKSEVEPLPWPSYPRARLDTLKKQIEDRVGAVGSRFVETSPLLEKKFFARQAARFALWRMRTGIVDYAMKKVTDDLARFQLLR
jgi:hypothetical protein